MASASSTSGIASSAAPRPLVIREYGLDWLRVFAFGVLIFYHSGMMFVTWGFHIENEEKSRALELVMLFFNRWRLPLLFFISGAGVAFSLRRRGWGTFALERLRRLGIPLLFGILVVVPPQIYFERLFRGQVFDSYWAFWKTVFDFVPYPQGNTSWHHLWFVAYILVYSLIGIPIFAWLRSGTGRGAVTALAGWVERFGPALYLINIPSIAVGLTLGPHWPTTHNLTSDWANLTGSFVTFLWGFVIASSPRWLNLIERRRREFLIGGVLIAAIFYLVPLRGVPRELVSAYFGMLWIFTLIGYARHYIRRGSPMLTYCTEAVYPFYIVHQTVTIAAGYYIIQQPWPLLVKLLAAMTATFLGSWATFEVVKRTRVTRMLFGLKPD